MPKSLRLKLQDDPLDATDQPEVLNHMPKSLRLKPSAFFRSYPDRRVLNHMPKSLRLKHQVESLDLSGITSPQSYAKEPATETYHRERPATFHSVLNHMPKSLRLKHKTEDYIDRI